MESKEPVINVGILTSDVISFVLNGVYQCSNGENHSGEKQVLCKDGKIYFNNQFYDELVFTPVVSSTDFELKDVIIGINFHWERKENQRFGGSLKFIIDNRSLIAINEIGTEDYLTSVISSEMSATASIELLKAHAVISRSWLLKPIMSGNESFTKSANDAEITANELVVWYERDCHSQFDVCADDHCQRYQGVTKSSVENVKIAIESTKGEVLVYEGKICDARFSKSCGGMSEHFENCWAPIHFPYLTPVYDLLPQTVASLPDLKNEKVANDWIRQSPPSFCNTTDKSILGQVLNNYDQETTDFYRWKVEYSQKELADIISQRSGIDFGEICDLIPLERGDSGRIIRLKIVGTKRSITVGKELEIRKWLSNSHLYSSAFVVDRLEFINDIPQKFTLTGAGWGHGVGLCQIGAAVMGERGYKYQEILQHYFKGASLERFY